MNCDKQKRRVVFNDFQFPIIQGDYFKLLKFESSKVRSFEYTLIDIGKSKNPIAVDREFDRLAPSRMKNRSVRTGHDSRG
jgi:hypothetical protein